MPASHSQARTLSHACLIALIALLPGLASASLGEKDSSTRQDAAQVKGSLKVQARALYDLHEIQMTSGTVVREFVDRSGNVFAVTWKGPTAPDLRQLLGRYFDRYAAGAKRQAPNHRHLEVLDKELVVHAGGHMRALSGLAYLKDAVPSGVDLGDLK